MEILGPNFLRIAFDVALVVTAMSALVLAVIVAVRLSAQSETLRAADFRREIEPLVTAYLVDREEPVRVIKALQRKPEQSLTLLMEIADRLERAERAPLTALLTSLPLREREAAALQHRNWQRRLQAAERLGYLGDGVSVPALLDALQDPVLAVRFAAARSLASLGETRAIPTIVHCFDMPGEMNQRRVADMLHAFGQPAVEPLLHVLANAHGTYSDNAIDVAARVLGMLRASEAVEPLTELLGRSDFRVRLHAVRALGQIGDHSTGDAIAHMAGDPAWEVRNVVMQALGRLRAERHVASLTSGLRDRSWWVRFSAAQALWQLGDPGRKALTAAMTGDSDRFARDTCRQVLEEHGALAVRETKL
jgi:HEAT repeat protein